MSEQCYFINPNFTTNTTVAQPYFNTFDIAGRVQTVESMFNDLSTTIQRGMIGLDILMNRQRKQQSTLMNFMRDVTSDLYIEQVFASLGVTKAKDTFNVWQSSWPILEWDSMVMDKVSEEFEIIQGDFKAQIVDNVIASIDTDTLGVYTRVHYRLASGKVAPVIIEVPKDKVAKKNNIYQIYIKTPASDFTLYQDILDGAIGLADSQDQLIVPTMVSELIVFYKNTLIDKRNHLYVKAYPVEALRDEIITGEETWKTDTEISNISLMSLGEYNVCDLTIIAEGKVYKMQCGSAYNNNFSRLELLGYSPDLNTTYFKFPFPVDLTSPINIYKNLNTGVPILNWEYSFTSTLGPWNPAGKLSDFNQVYPITEFTTTKKELYIKVNTFCDSGYARYTASQVLNCSWPLSEDKKFLWTGGKIECKVTGPMQITARMTSGYNQFNWNSELLNFIFPLGQIGIS
jgi:hypothetical protein